jgi:thiamine-monophosphate kinase
VTDGAEPDDEDAWVAGAVARFGPHPFLVGPGDDCAALRLEGADALVVTTDVVVDGVHFVLRECGPEAAGRKALLVNLSDLAAAGAVPLGFEVGVVLPRGTPREAFDRLVDGMASAATRWSCPCAGGDVNVADAPLTIAVTAFGRPGPMGVVTRAGARAGDVLSVTGPLGGSLAGRHLDFVPRVREALALARRGVPHAMMDLSDGLSRDLPRLARRSGVGAEVAGDLVPVHADAARAPPPGRTPLEHALHDGEDFELLVAHAPLADATRRALEAEGVVLHEVGRVTEAARGIRLVVGGAAEPLAPRGFDHVAGRGRGRQP